jgi:hypothetical protein
VMNALQAHPCLSLAFFPMGTATCMTGGS